MKAIGVALVILAALWLVILLVALAPAGTTCTYSITTKVPFCRTNQPSDAPPFKVTIKPVP